MKKIRSSTRLVHVDRLINRPEDGAVHEPTNNSVLFDFEDVADLEAVFQGTKTGHVYSRSSSGSALALQNILNELDQGIGACVFATGMAAISGIMFSLLKAGDHIIVSKFLFGNTRSFFDHLQQFGIEVSYVDISSIEQVQAAAKTNTRLVFCETIANPTTQVADMSNIGLWCKQSHYLFVVDNTLTPSVMFDAHKVNASLLCTSLTKYTSGHGNALGGVVIDLGSFDWSLYPNIDDIYKSYDQDQWGLVQIRKKGLRDMGATISPHAAHMISVGLETLEMRMRQTCENAMHLATFFEKHDAIKGVYYPGLSNHPEHQIAKKLFAIASSNSESTTPCFGGLLSIELDDSYDIRTFLNALNVVLRATHLGDTRTLALPVASTIFYENGLEKRKEMEISENLIRISIGIENINDLVDDFEQAIQSAHLA